MSTHIMTSPSFIQRSVIPPNTSFVPYPVMTSSISPHIMPQTPFIPRPVITSQTLPIRSPVISPVQMSQTSSIRPPVMMSDALYNVKMANFNNESPIHPSNNDWNNFILPLEIHKSYGVIDIPGIRVVEIKESSRAGKKYAITITYNGITKTIHYGNSHYQQYEDRTPIKAFIHMDHHDNGRRKSYLARSSKITDSTGLAANNPFSANRYSIITLW